MSQFSVRPVVSLDMPLSLDVTILKPEQVVLRFTNTETIDIGALCYLQRETTPIGGGRRKSGEGRKVLQSSLCPIRGNHIRAFIIHISNEVRLGRKRPTTIHFDVRQFSVFMTWADGNGYSSVLDDATSARLAVSAYAAHVRERVVNHAISLNTGVSLQRDAFVLLSEFLGIENLTRGMNLLRRDSSAVEPTAPPSEDDQGRMLSLCEALFTGLTTQVLEGKPYPFGITMPSHLGYPENIMWVFPAHIWCLPAASLATHLAKRGATSFGCGYNYRSGRLSTRAEVMVLDKYKDTGDPYREDATHKNVTAMLKNSKKIMDSANSSSVHWHRRYMGMVALNAFTTLFLSRTGMNWAQAMNLTWSGSYTDAVSTIRQKFRSIKYRAGGKEVYYQLPLMFMPLFKRFLQLRDYLLQDYPEFERLFFTMGNRAAEAPSSVKVTMKIITRNLQRIDPALVPILSRAWRAAKSDWLITRTDVSTTAQLLQNVERTVLNAYAAGAIATHLTEMSSFLDQMVVDKGAVLDSCSTIAVGECALYGAPHVIPGVIAAVQPTCQSPEVGCLFCDKFKIHADEIDVRKLLSCHYCLTRTSHLAGFHTMSEPIIDRIQFILDVVHSRDSSLVPRITQEVAEGELDPYWASKYDMLLRLRLVNDAD